MDPADDPKLPGSVRDLDTLEQRVGRIEAHLDRRDQMPSADGRNRHDEVVARLEAARTNLLKAIRTHNEANRRRAGGDAENAVLTSRIALLEARVMEIEKRLDLPPAR
jgi:hypothetical protein